MKNKTVFKRVIAVIGRSKLLLFLSLILSVASVILSLYIPVLAGRAIDGIKLHGNVDFEVIKKCLFGILICAIDGIPMMAALFETASAIGTVGLSLAGTAELSVPSRLILMCLMYFGRVGGLTLIYAVSTNGKNTAQYPVEQVTVG